MTQIPPNTVSQKDLEEWFKMQEELKRLKAAEMLLRKRIFGFFFPSPVEGTNTAPLADGWVIKGKYPIDRKVEQPLLEALSPKLVEAKISADKLVKYEPALVLSEYRELTEEERHLFDQCLTVKPGSPALEIVLPKKASK